MGDSEFAYGSTLSLDSMKVIAESVGIANLGDDAAKELADDVSYRLKVIVQDAMKFMHHSKRQKLSITDIDHTLKTKNIEVKLLRSISKLCLTLFLLLYMFNIKTK